MEVNYNFSEKAKRDFILVQEAKKGNQRAYSELLGYYRDSIYYLLLKMVKNEADAEDLTIEAFGKAFRNLELYVPSFAFSTWLFKIASNNAIDYLRSKKVKQKYISIDNSYEDEETGLVNKFSLVSNSPDPEEKMISEQKDKLIRAVIKNLHPDYKRIIKLRYFDELSYLEIAEKLELPIGTVKARLFRSRELLMSILKQKQINPDRF
jgi:RNA polymerase sigma-70 factor (ECF subfamily)